LLHVGLHTLLRAPQELIKLQHLQHSITATATAAAAECMLLLLLLLLLLSNQQLQCTKVGIT
jgi:hypothetical protein